MDKRTLIALALILVITLLMPYYQRWILGDKVMKTPVEQVDTLSTAAAQKDTATLYEQYNAALEKEAAAPAESVIPEETPSDIKKIVQEAPEVKEIYIENEFIRAKISTQKGANPTLWELKKYDYYQGGKVNLVYQNGLDVEVTNRDGKIIKLSDFNLYSSELNPDKIILNEKNPTAELEFYLPMANGRIVKRMRFYYDQYAADVIVYFENLRDYVINRRYFFNWNNGLPSTEENVKEDFSYARAYAYMAGELEDLDVSKEKSEEKELNGRVDWAAIRSKYFLAAIIPINPKKTNGVTLSGNGVKLDGELHKIYDVSLEIPYDPAISQRDTFKVFIGPLDYGVLKSYKVDLQTLVMNKDWYERLFRPISLLILPAFKLLHGFIPNYGLVIIIFSILIKLLLHPLTRKSYQSMSEMQYIQPKLTELREKYKNDPQRLNKEMMRLYKEHGINPLGGCLPMLLQMPLLFALFIVFRSTIQLRGQPFILWITDLSRPDTLSLGMQFPFIGDSIHVLPILMALTMIWQSKMTVTDPKQKFMVYFMPIFMVFIFYSLPSGLNLYYSVFNVLSMFQTRMIKKKMHPGDNKEAATETKAVAKEKPKPVSPGKKKPRRR